LPQPVTTWYPFVGHCKTLSWLLSVPTMAGAFNLSFLRVDTSIFTNIDQWLWSFIIYYWICKNSNHSTFFSLRNLKEISQFFKILKQIIDNLTELRRFLQIFTISDVHSKNQSCKICQLDVKYLKISILDSNLKFSKFDSGIT